MCIVFDLNTDTYYVCVRFEHYTNEYCNHTKNSPSVVGVQVKNQYTVLSSQGRTPDRKPSPKKCMKFGWRPCLLVNFMSPLITYLPVKDASLKPSHFATTEFIPSHPTNTFSIAKHRYVVGLETVYTHLTSCF